MAESRFPISKGIRSFISQDILNQHVEYIKTKKQRMKNWYGGKRFLGILCSLVLLSILSTTLLAQTNSSSAIQLVTLEVKPISKISVSGNPGPLVIRNTTSFSDVYSISDENTTYSLITNVDNMKIVASINNRMPEGTRLMLKVANNRAASAGQVDVSNALTPVDVVTGIGKGKDVDQSISYTFIADADVLEVPAQSRTLILTLTN